MPGIAPHPPTRIVFRGRRCLRPLLLAVIALLVFAAIADADENAPGAGGTLVVEPAAQPGESSPPAPAPEGGGESPAPAPEASPTGEPPASAGPPPSPEPAPEGSPAPEAPAAAPEPAPASAPEAPAPAAPELVVPEAAAPEAASPEPVETVGGRVPLESGPEAAGEPRTAHPESGPSRPEAPGTAPFTRLSESSAATVETTPAPPQGPTAAAPALSELAPVGPFAQLTGVAYGSSAEPAQIVIGAASPGALGCGDGSAGCMAAALPAIQRLLSGSPGPFSGTGGSLAVTRGGVPTGSGHGGSTPSNPPLSPTPAPAPSGAAGGAGVGGSGVAPTASLTHAALLLLAAPHARRRLRLSARPWRTAFFVLIPERPG